MGKGDQKTTRGKRARGSYGKTRPKPSNSRSVLAAKVSNTAAKEKAAKAVKPAKDKTVKDVKAKTAAKKPAAKKAPAKKAEA